VTGEGKDGWDGEGGQEERGQRERREISAHGQFEKSAPMVPALRELVGVLLVCLSVGLHPATGCNGRRA